MDIGDNGHRGQWALRTTTSLMAAPVVCGPIVSDAIVSGTHRARPHPRRTHRPWPYLRPHCPRYHYRRRPSSVVLSSSAPPSAVPLLTTPIVSGVIFGDVHCPRPHS